MSVEKEQFDKVMGELRRACLPAGGADVVQAYVDSLASDLARVETERRHDLQIQSAMAADQKAVAAALGIPPGEYSGGAGEQLLAIEKLREALARVEASAATLATAGRGAWNRSNATQAQLAEAVGLLGRVDGMLYQWQADQLNIKPFLARHAQDEQQEAPMSNLPFVEQILADLRRFQECVEDNNDVNLERSRFDLLVELGLLKRVQRSPARWMMTQAGEDAIAQPAAGEPVYQLRNTVVGNIWRDADKDAYDSAAKLAEYERRILWTTPPAAARGDEAATLVQALSLLWKTTNFLPRGGSLDGRVSAFLAQHAPEPVASAAAMRAQGDGEAKR